MGHRFIPADTSEEAARVQYDILRCLSPSRRLEIALRLSDDVRELSACGVRRRHPDYNEEQVRLAVTRLTLGDVLFHEVYPGVDIAV